MGCSSDDISQNVLRAPLWWSKKKGKEMNFLNPEQVNQVLDRLPYPVGKAQVVELARQFKVNDQIVGLLERLPNKTYNSSQDIQNDLQSLGNLGKFGL
jgi:hypothetical protein